MSAADIATVVEGWATLAGLFVLVAGAVFAGVQLRQEAKARHLQAIMAVLTDIRPPEVAIAQRRVLRLPDGFDPLELSEDDLNDLLMVVASYARLGNLLAAGLVKEDDIFPHINLSKGAVDAWEKVKHVPRNNPMAGGLPPAMFFEYLAAHAQDYLAREGARRFGSIPPFDADPSVMESVAAQVQQARAAAR